MSRFACSCQLVTLLLHLAAVDATSQRAAQRLCVVVVHRLRRDAVEVDRQPAHVGREPHFGDSELHKSCAPRLDSVRRTSFVLSPGTEPRGRLSIHDPRWGGRRGRGAVPFLGGHSVSLPEPRSQSAFSAEILRRPRAFAPFSRRNGQQPSAGNGSPESLGAARRLNRLYGATVGDNEDP